MESSLVTAHAGTRMVQRAIRDEDLELITWIGTEVEGGYLVRAKDCQAVEQWLKRLMDKVRRLKGKRVVIADGGIVTVYHARRSKERRLLCRAEQRSMQK
jgi:hypothetical protein